MSFSDGGTALPPNPFTALEQIRRRQGALLEASGWGPVQSDSEILVSRPCMRVRSYQPAGGGGPAVLLVPAPIKRAYIWDLEPSRSPVRLLSEAGFSVHLVEWMDPGPEERGLGLGDYAGDLLLAAAETVRFATDQAPDPRRPLLGRHLRHPLGGPAPRPGSRPRAARGTPPLRRRRGRVRTGGRDPPDAEWAKVVFGNVPGSFISIASATAAPVTFHLERYLDFLTTVGHPPFQIHMRVERWSLDEMAMPGQLFEDIVEELYRHDRLMRGQLVLRGRRIAPERVGCPLLTVLNPSSRITPPQSVLPFHEAASSDQKTLITYGGDRGVALQHVGVLVGANAHAHVWPAVVQWLRELVT
jgi:polyhydroxyalkanoate synthase